MATTFTLDSLKHLDDPFKETPASEGGGGILPEGKYRLRLDAYDPGTTQKGALRVNLELIVVGGELDGRKCYKTWVLESVNDDGSKNAEKTKTLLSMFKGDLKKLGVKVEDPKFSIANFLTKHLEKLLDVEFLATVKHNKSGDQTRANIYIDKLAGADVDATAVDSAGDDAASDEFDPFAEE